MTEILQNNVRANDYDKIVSEVLTQLNTGKDKHGEGAIGTAYIDWGITGDFYKNCPSKTVADKVARAFKDKGYYVYIQRMGYGNRRIPEGTPISYRIYKEARKYNDWDEI